MKGMLMNLPPVDSKYVNISKGKFVNGSGSDRTEHTALTGFITDLDITDEKFEAREFKKVRLAMKLNGEECELGFSLGSGYCSAFVCLAGSINFEKPVTFTPTYQLMKDSTTKHYGGLLASQDGEWLTWFIKEKTENPTAKKLFESRPKGEEKKAKGEKYFDTTKRDAWDYEFLSKKVRPKILNAAKITDAIASKPAPVPDAADVTEPIDDLPF